MGTGAKITSYDNSLPGNQLLRNNKKIISFLISLDLLTRNELILKTMNTPSKESNEHIILLVDIPELW